MSLLLRPNQRWGAALRTSACGVCIAGPPRNVLNTALEWLHWGRLPAGTASCPPCACSSYWKERGLSANQKTRSKERQYRRDSVSLADRREPNNTTSLKPGNRWFSGCAMRLDWLSKTGISIGHENVRFTWHWKNDPTDQRLMRNALKYVNQK